jgi:NAD(P)-dependent dehydrogenase (short-subunit alcohol dehydrogenase family)
MNAKTVLVTGGAKRIGQAICVAFAKAGWNVAVHYGTSYDEAQITVQQLRAYGAQATALQADLAVETQTAQLASAAFAAFGRLDAVVNNASLFEMDVAHDFSYGGLMAHMRPNLAAPIVLARELHRLLPPEARGVVVNLLDQKLFNYNPDFLSYTLSKAGLQAATTMLAQALAPKVRVVGVAPGITMLSGDQTASGFEQAHTATPLGKSSTPKDVAQTCLFAAESAAITGTTIVVDGGQHLVPSSRDVMFLTGEHGRTNT